MIIRRNQMEQMHLALDQNQARGFADRLRQQYTTEVAEVSADELLAQLRSDLKLAATLGFEDDDDLWRFVQLRYWPFEVLSQQHLQSAIVAVMTRTEWPPTKRLDFLERHVRRRIVKGL